MTERIAELQRKRAALVQHGRELADERASVSFQAHCGHEPEARRRLGEVNAELALLDSELRNIDAAIAELSKSQGVAA
jgi:hypothetical protein